MTKPIAKELKEFVDIVAQRFSRKDREGNLNNEDFFVEDILPTSDHTAVVRFKKNSGKVGLAFFYYIPRGMSKGWKYFFPTDSHINGFRAFELEKYQVEKENYKHNF
jgi:hypothetical protein|tara:strand:- start:124 stop:444 length:321 start_codon:yes stop_codon:yes gene_type:complete